MSGMDIFVAIMCIVVVAAVIMSFVGDKSKNQEAETKESHNKMKEDKE